MTGRFSLSGGSWRQESSMTFCHVRRIRIGLNLNFLARSCQSNLDGCGFGNGQQIVSGRVGRHNGCVEPGWDTFPP